MSNQRLDIRNFDPQLSNIFLYIITTTSLAGGLLWPYKGLLSAKPKGLSKKILLLQYSLRCPSDYWKILQFSTLSLSFSFMACYSTFTYMSQNSYVQYVVGEPTFLHHWSFLLKAESFLTHLHNRCFFRFSAFHFSKEKWNAEKQG